MKMKKFLAVILSAAMAFGMMSFSALADETETSYAKIGDTYYADLSDAIEAAKSGDTVTLLSDVDLTGVEWGDYKKTGITFDGGNHTIKNLKMIKNSDYGLGFFKSLTSSTVKNVTFENADIANNEAHNKTHGNIYAVVSAYAYGTITFDNVHVTNSKVAAYGKVGALIGMLSSNATDTLTFNDCTVTNTALDGAYNVGAFAGRTNITPVVSGNSYVENNTVTLLSSDELASDWSYETLTFTAKTDDYEITVTNGNYYVWAFVGASYPQYNGKYLLYAASGDFYTGVELTGDPNFTIGNKTYVCGDGFGHDATVTIGTRKYLSLANAVAAAKDGDIITVEKNISDMSVVTITQGKNITIDLNGKTIETALESEGRHYYAFNNYGTLTLKDSSDNSTGTIKSRGIYNYADGAITIENGNYYSVDNNGGACVWNTANSTLTVKDGTFTAWDPESTVEPDAKYGPGCLSNAGTAYIYGGTFNDYNRRCYAIISTGTMEITPADGKEVSVYGVHVALGIDSGKTTINGGSYSSQNYYGLYAATGNTTVIVNGGTFDGKSSSVCLEKYEGSNDYCTIEINNGTFNKGFSHTSNTDSAKIIVNNGTFATDVSDFCADGYEATANGDGTYSITVKIAWTTDTDSGYYMNGNTKLGIMRFIFNTDITGDVTEYGIKYINADDISASPSGSNVSGTGNVKSFYGDVDGAPESATGTYYSRAFVTTANGTFWSNPVSCKIDWSRLLDYTMGGVQ